MIVSKPRKNDEAVLAALNLIDDEVLSFIATRGTTIDILGGRRYNDASPELRRLGIDVDSWPTPPAGLFVVAERRLYLRSTCVMTVVHELGHAFDLALSPSDAYWTTTVPTWRTEHAKTMKFVTPYAAAGEDESFAEAFRAWWDANNSASPWPKVTRERLRNVSPALHRTMERCITQVLRNASAA